MKIPSEIKNKIKREDEYNKQRTEKNREKLKRRIKNKKDEKDNDELRQERLKKNVPKTLENTREVDETIVNGDEEVLQEEETDEFADYFKGDVKPNLLVTTCRRPSAVNIIINVVCL